MTNAEDERNSGWVGRYLEKELTDFQRDAVNLLCRAQGCGPYDFSSTWPSAQWEFGKGVRFTIRGGRMATFDGSGLTTLIIGSHDMGIRVEIEPCNMQRIAVIMHPRPNRNTGSTWSRHPTIEQAVETYRK